MTETSDLIGQSNVATRLNGLPARSPVATAGDGGDGVGFSDMMVTACSAASTQCPVHDVSQAVPDQGMSAPSAEWTIGAAFGLSRVREQPAEALMFPLSVSAGLASAISSPDGRSARDDPGLDFASEEVMDSNVPVITGSIISAIVGDPVPPKLVLDTAIESFRQPPLVSRSSIQSGSPRTAASATPALAVANQGDGMVGVTVVAQERHFALSSIQPSLERVAAITPKTVSRAGDATPETSVADSGGEVPATAAVTTAAGFITPARLRGTGPQPWSDPIAALSHVSASVDAPRSTEATAVTAPAPQSVLSPFAVPVSIAQQVVTAIDQSNTPAAPGVASMGSDPLSQGRAQDAVRVLVIKLEPAELGMVTIRLTLKGDTLSVSMAAGERSTMAILEHQRGLLTEDLKVLGHTIGEVSVILADPAPSPGTSATSETGGGSPQGAYNGSREGGNRDGGQDGGHRARHGQVPLPPDDLASGEPEGRRVPAPLRPGIYL